MKKPSIYQLAQDTRAAFSRYPLVVISVLIGSLAGIYLVQITEVSG